MMDRVNLAETFSRVSDSWSPRIKEASISAFARTSLVMVMGLLASGLLSAPAVADPTKTAAPPADLNALAQLAGLPKEAWPMPPPASAAMTGATSTPWT